MPDFGTLARTGRPLVLPGAHDALTARLIEDAGFAAYGIGGSALAATQLALPDAGLQSFGEYRDAVARIMEGSDLPVMVDGENGFGDAKAVTRTMRSLERLGVSAVAFEDLVLPARLDRPPAIDRQDVMEGKLKAALDARSNAELRIVGRTDAAYAIGLEAALDRAGAYVALGVDAILVPGLPDLDAYRRLRATVSVPIIAVVVPGSPWFAPGMAQLAETGIEAAVCPATILTRVVQAIQQGLQQLQGGDASPAEGFDLRSMGTIVRAAQWAGIDGRQPV